MKNIENEKLYNELLYNLRTVKDLLPEYDDRYRNKWVRGNNCDAYYGSHNNLIGKVFLTYSTYKPYEAFVDLEFPIGLGKKAERFFTEEESKEWVSSKVWAGVIK